MPKEATQKFWGWLIFGVFALLAVCIAGSRMVDAWNRWPTEERLAWGQKIFEHKWEPNDAMPVEGDGLGPVFNAKSCVECHFQGGIGGGGPNEFNVLSFEVFPFGDRQNVIGGVIHAAAIDEELEESSERLHRLYPAVKGEIRIVDGCQVQIPAIDPVVFNQINTPALFGAGLIEKISSGSIQLIGLKRNIDAVSRSLDGDFSATPVGRVRTLSGGRVGRFGWKGQFATLEEFVATACAVELGLTNPLRAQDIPHQHKPDAEAKLDIDQDQLRALVCYIENLPRPEQILPDDMKQRAIAGRGEELFSEIGCADCHTPTMGNVEGIYSDFRLHDVESDETGSYGGQTITIADVPDGHPKPQEWKTPPLWGVADSAPYFHDGLSSTLQGAISRHADEAQVSKTAYDRLSREDRDAVVAFLETLRAPIVEQ